MTKKNVLISGANGLLGQHLCLFFSKQGWLVRGFVRNTFQNLFPGKNISLFKCILPNEIQESAFDGVDVFIHCAYTTRFSDLEKARQVNEVGTKKLYELCQKKGIRFVFISSTAAHPAAHSYYGKSKLNLEQWIDKEKDLIIKPGLILADTEKGLFSRIQKAIGRFPILPLLGGDRCKIQTIHIDDLCNAIFLALTKDLKGCYTVAEPDGISVGAFWNLVGRKLKKKPILLPLPLAPFLFVARLFEHFHIQLPFSSENLLGLQYSRILPSEKDLKAIGITVSSAAQSIDRLYENKNQKPF